ncbi:MAG: thiamine phosphate synthase [Magnetococcales bacterium]|nr:thiamine phosphate synthase [Magnetococcales bacterium]
MTRDLSFLAGIYPILDAAWLQQHLREEDWPVAERIRLVRDMENAGIRLLQLRCKNSLDQATAFFERWLKVLRSEMEQVRVILNDHVSLALKLQADGVHVGQDDTPIAECRALLGPDLLIGLSTHNRAEVEDSLATSADYIGFGPLFQTSSKPDAQIPSGLDGLKIACRFGQKPIVAIGGIQPEHLSRIAFCGAHAAAMISGLWGTNGRFLIGQCVREFARGLENRYGNFNYSAEHSE